MLIVRSPGSRRTVFQTTTSFIDIDYAIPGSRRILTGCQPAIWDWASSLTFVAPRKKLKAFPRHDLEHTGIAWHPTGDLLAVSVPALGTRSGVASVTGAVYNSARDAIADGQHRYPIASSRGESHQKPTIHLIHLKTGKVTKLYSPNEDWSEAFHELRFSPSGDFFACRQDQQGFVLCDLRKNQAKTFRFDEKPYCSNFSFDFSSDERSVFVLSQSNSSFQRRNLENGSGELILENVRGGSVNRYGNNRFLCGSKIVNLADRSIERELDNRADITSFCPKGRHVIGAINNSTRLVKWDQESLVSEPFYAGEFKSFAASPDGAFVAAGYDDGRIKVWETTSRRLLGVLRGHTGPVDDLEFHPQRQILASASRDGNILFWKVGQAAKAADKTRTVPDIPTHFRFDLDGGGQIEAHFPSRVSKVELIHSIEGLLFELKQKQANSDALP